jgi:TolB-like protein
MIRWVVAMGLRTRFFILGVLGCAAIAAAALSGCASNPEYFRSDTKLEQPATLAVMPLVNLSKYDEAGDVVMNSLLIQLLDIDFFEIVDPGLVDNAVLERRIRFTDRLPLATLQELGRDLNAEYMLLGSVNEFDMITSRTETVPLVSISVRIVRSETGTIFWAATHTRRGDDAESIFGLGRIMTLEQLTAVAVKDIAGTLKNK